MRRYQQITPEERYTLGLLRKQGCSDAEIARVLGRDRSTIWREVRRNYSRHDGAYRPEIAQERTNGRRRRSRRNSQFSLSEWSLVERLLRDKFSTAGCTYAKRLSLLGGVTLARGSR
ncbi:MAG TPA: helix-turn-helix domain-containing protein [Bryobacterales bacterium]|nr:helix-turn-helix domain-containing protein [Bryobacterales bacterium]